jgi:hypothetical protein
MLNTVLLKRAAEEAIVTIITTEKGVPGDDGDVEVIQVPTKFFVILFVITIVALAFWVPVSYCLEHVIATLTMIESPTSSIALSDSQTQPLAKAVDAVDPVDGSDAHPLPPAESSPKVITNGIRSTIRHITAQGGFTARWRGFRIFALYSFLFALLHGTIAVLVPIPGLSMLLTIILLSPIHAGMTHAIIAAPGSQKSIRARILPRSAYKKLIVPSAVLGATYALWSLVHFVLSLCMLRTESEISAGSAFARVILVFLVLFSIATFVILPALVAMVRIEASMLPEDEDTIVPFDRTYGGKVQSEELGGSGVLTFNEAIRSFSWEARLRLIKLYAKIFAITIAFVFALMTLLVAVTAMCMDHEQIGHVARKGMQTVGDLR